MLRQGTLLLWRQRHLVTRSGARLVGQDWAFFGAVPLQRAGCFSTDEIPQLNQTQRPDPYDYLGDRIHSDDDDYIYDDADKTRHTVPDNDTANPYDDIVSDPSSLNDAAWEENDHQEAWEDEDEWDGDSMENPAPQRVDIDAEVHRFED